MFSYKWALFTQSQANISVVDKTKKPTDKVGFFCISLKKGYLFRTD
ncbi:protein of unknown function [Xenorhabdus doucetiae]|uniref:Uncharacterized protein n=1 Tax=Xenorhabdus doucetiae TaxID=351671 RepID=A0A068QXF1_9GAMM|nr:protein of unknown function [Xenorhabdus doucetiae]